MYQVTTNYGVYNFSLMPSVMDLLKYYHTAHAAGIAIDDIKIEIKEIPEPKCVSITTILRDVA